MRRVDDRIRGFIDREILDGAVLAADPLAEGMLDSLATEQLVDFLEREFAIRFTDDELVPERFASIDTVARLVESKLA